MGWSKGLRQRGRCGFEAISSQIEQLQSQGGGFPSLIGRQGDAKFPFIEGGEGLDLCGAWRGETHGEGARRLVMVAATLQPPKPVPTHLAAKEGSCRESNQLHCDTSASINTSASIGTYRLK